MFVINIPVDTTAIEALYRAYEADLLKRLTELQDTVFDISVGDTVYRISYKLENGEILLFSHDSNGFDDRKIAMPRLRLNLSRHFLPDALNPDGTPADPFYDVDMGCELSSDGGLDRHEVVAVMAEIRKKGLLSIIGIKKQ